MTTDYKEPMLEFNLTYEWKVLKAFTKPSQLGNVQNPRMSSPKEKLETK